MSMNVYINYDFYDKNSYKFKYKEYYKEAVDWILKEFEIITFDDRERFINEITDLLPIKIKSTDRFPIKAIVQCLESLSGYEIEYKLIKVNTKKELNHKIQLKKYQKKTKLN